MKRVSVSILGGSEGMLNVSFIMKMQDDPLQEHGPSVNLLTNRYFGDTDLKLTFLKEMLLLVKSKHFIALYTVVLVELLSLQMKYLL